MKRSSTFLLAAMTALGLAACNPPKSDRGDDRRHRLGIRRHAGRYVDHEYAGAWRRHGYGHGQDRYGHEDGFDQEVPSRKPYGA